MPDWLVAVILFDVAVTLAAVVFVLRLRASRVGKPSPDPLQEFRALFEFSKQNHERIAEYVRANWSGSLEALPQVLESLVGQLEREAQERRLSADRDMLKVIISRSLEGHRIARGRDLQKALDRVA
jgi:hypothetical protein